MKKKKIEIVEWTSVSSDNPKTIFKRYFILKKPKENKKNVKILYLNMPMRNKKINSEKMSTFRMSQNNAIIWLLKKAPIFIEFI